MTKRIVYMQDNGVVAVVCPAPAWLAEEGNTLEKCAERSVPEGKEWRIVDITDIPEDRTFRDAWTDEYDTPTVDINMDKAKDIHIDTLRMDRNEKLAALDVPFQIALEKNDTTSLKTIAEQKQALRDMPVQAIKEMGAIATPEELKEYVPDVLKEEEK